MLRTILLGFSRLTDFKGRDGHLAFWPYAFTVMGLLAVIGTAAFAPTFAEAMNRMQRFALDHPDQATVSATATSYSIQIRGSHPELAPDFRGIVAASAVGLVAAVILLAGAVVRRLHDRNRTGLWGLGPIPFAIVAMVAFPRLADQFGRVGGPDLRLFFALFLNNWLYLAALALLAFLLWGDGTPGPNRFGPPPA